MKNINKKINIFRGLALGFLFMGMFSVLSPSVTEASVVPTLTVTANSGDQVQIVVNGDVNSNVTLYYHPNYSSSLSSTNIGTTNGSGYFVTNLNGNGYNIQSGSAVYVMVNGQQSSSVNWPYYNSNNNSGVYLSQGSLSLTSGQSYSVNIYGGNNSYYVSSNSNSSIVSASISNNILNIYSNNSGSANIVVCSNSSTYGCATLYVTVSGYNNGNGNYQSVTLGQNNISLSSGQSTNVSVYGGTNTYYISSNSNSYVANVSLSGNTLNVYGQNSGSTNVTVCSSNVTSGNNYYNYNSCANLYITVGGNYYNYNNNYNNGGTYYGGTTYSYPTRGTNVSGVFLNQIPYTGIGENIKMTLFVIGMTLWSAFMAWILLKKRLQFAPAHHAPLSFKEKIEEFKRQNLARKNLK